METKLLLAIDLSEDSLKAINYTADILSRHPAVGITLLHVIKEPSPDLVPSSEERRRHLETLRVKSLALMEQAAQRLIVRGISEKHVHLAVQVCKEPKSVAEMILQEQRTGGYGTIVIGRRGISKREEFLFGSTSSRVIREAKNCAVWVVE